MMSRLVRAPVVHFLLIGIAIFVAYGALAPARRDASRIVVSQGAVDNLVREFESRWRRSPTGLELSGMVEAHVRDEILYREGVALGLERDDVVIKRRVRQKLEVIAEEEIARAAPADEDLAAYLAHHAGRFARPGVVTFEQVLFPATATFADVHAARVAAARGGDPTRLGRSSLLPSSLSEAPSDLIARDFGAGFAAELLQLPMKEWTGPVRSGLGLHLVRVTQRTPTTAPVLAEVRGAVAREWESDRRTSALAEGYRKLRAQYKVVIEARQLASLAPR